MKTTSSMKSKNSAKILKIIEQNPNNASEETFNSFRHKLNNEINSV